MILYFILAFVTVIKESFLFIKALGRLRSGGTCIQDFVYMVFYFFFVFPILSQILVPDYHYIIFYRADDAMRDMQSNMIYLAFVWVFSFFIQYSATKDRKIVSDKLEVQVFVTNICTWMVVICFAITLALSGLQVILGGYGYAYLNQEVISVNEGIIGCGIISFLIVLGSHRYVSKFRIAFLSIFVFGFFWIVGKRYIIAETLVMTISILGMTRGVSGKGMVKGLFLGGAFIVIGGFLYGVFFKKNVDSFLDYLNVDFSRQYTLVYQFYCDKIGRQISINQYDGIVYLLTFFVPRIFWFDKPYPFVNYLTLSLVGQDEVAFENAGWATTCSIFSDLYDSFSYLGLGLGIWLLVTLFHKVNRESRCHYKVLLLYLIIRLLTVQISSSIVQITVVFFIVTIASWLGRKKKYYNISSMKHVPHTISCK